MKENFKILFYIGIVFLSSFLVLGLFLEGYSEGLLTSEKNVITIGAIIDQNPKQVTLDVLQNILGDVQKDEVNINSLGFRGNEFIKIKPDNTFRIFLLGGSQMFGTGATSDDTTIPGYIENYLDPNDYDFTVEIINSGLKGIDSRKELLLLENMLLDFTPDLVIVYDGLNDLRAGNSSTQIFDNWNSMCKLGQKNNFDVIITLQPIAGFAEKSLTQKELVYLQNGKDYENNPLIDSLYEYNLYANNLEKLENCTDKLDLRSVFDNELDSIYIDEAHVSDKGNSIVATSLLSNISSNISKDKIQTQSIINKIDKVESSIFLEFQYTAETLFSNFGKKLMQTPFSSSETNTTLENSEQSEKNILRTQTLSYEDDEIFIIIELPSLENESLTDQKIRIKTMSETNNSIIENVTYLMTITKNENELFTNYFYVENELIIQVDHTNDKNIKISGEREYDLDALVMNPDIPITISGSFFDSNSKYEFDISLRTIHDRDNFIFLNGFHAESLP